MLRLATGITPNFVPRADRFLKSLARFRDVQSTIFAVNFPSIPNFEVNHIQSVDYNAATVKLPKFMLQHGGFAQFAPAYWVDEDVIIFTDADAYLQRNFLPAEIDSMLSVAEGEMQVGYNRPNDAQTLQHEATCIFPKKPLPEIYREFPGTDGMFCRNFGFVVGRLSTWKELFRRTVALWPKCDACFGNPARVQWVACYALQQPGLRLADLSPVIHAHGHCGLKHGLERRGEEWFQDGKLVAFAHAL